MELRNPFAMRNGKVITIYDLDESGRGLKCDCTCPVCNGVFEAKMGEIRQWHFAHSGEPCDRTKQFVNSAFMLARQLLLEDKNMTFPGYNILGKTVFKAGNIPIHEAEIHYRPDGMADAIILNTNQLAVRIALDMDYCVGGLMTPVGEASTLLIDLTEIVGLNTDKLRERVCTGVDYKSWIYSKRAAREPQHNAMAHNTHQSFDDEEAEEFHALKEAKEYNPRKVTCNVCRKQVLKEDAMWGRNTRRYFCHRCVEARGLDWRSL